MRILVTGSHLADQATSDPKELVWDKLNELFGDALGWEEIVLIHGDAPGIDSIAADWAKDKNYGSADPTDPIIQILAFPADWDGLGLKAGPIRNTQMLKEGKPDIVLAFHDMPSLGKGTRDMVRQAMKAKIPIRLYWY